MTLSGIAAATIFVIVAMYNFFVKNYRTSILGWVSFIFFMIFFGLLWLDSTHVNNDVFALAISSVYLVFSAVSNLTIVRSKRPAKERIGIHTNLECRLIFFVLLILFALSLLSLLLRIHMHGYIFLEGDFYSKALDTSSGLLNRVIMSISLKTVLLSIVISFASYICFHKKSFLILSVLFVAVFLISGLLTGGKSAVFVLIVFTSLLHYYSFRSFLSIKLFSMVFLALTVFVFFFVNYVPNFLGSVEGILDLIVKRIFTVPASQLSYVMHHWSGSESFQFGYTFIEEVARVFSQIGIYDKVPLTNEVIANRIAGRDEDIIITGAAYTVFGNGYINFGLAGMYMYAVIFAIIITKIHNQLIAKKSISLVRFSMYIFFLFQLFNIILGSGNIILQMESVILNLIVYFSLFFAFYLLLKGVRFLLLQRSEC